MPFLSRELWRHLWKKQAILGWKKEVSQHGHNYCTELCLPRTSKSLSYYFRTWSRTQLWLPGKLLKCAKFMPAWKEFMSIALLSLLLGNSQFVFLLWCKHDSGSECTPGESKSQDMKEKGNYIMYARATSGDKLNNNKFSVCSVRNISQVLEKKRGNCFVGMFYCFPLISMRMFSPESINSHQLILILLFCTIKWEITSWF